MFSAFKNTCGRLLILLWEGRLETSILGEPLLIRLAHSVSLSIGVDKLETLHRSEDHGARQTIGCSRTHLYGTLTRGLGIGLTHLALLGRYSQISTFLRVKHAQRQTHCVIAVLSSFLGEDSFIRLLHKLGLFKAFLKAADALAAASLLCRQIGSTKQKGDKKEK